MFAQFIIATILVTQGCIAFQPRITDGKIADPHKYPYQVSIVWGFPPIIKYRHVCGGSILNENWILTAGHCIYGIPKIGRLTIQAGKHFIDRYEESEQTRDVGFKLVHRGFTGNVGQHDIAVLKLKSPLIFNDHVKPVVLPAPNKQHNGNVVLTGWGSTSKKFWPEYPNELQMAVVPVIDNDACLKSYDSLGEHVELFENQLCTGPIGGSVSPCAGDSGGPLVQLNANNDFEQVGIVSWGIFPCGTTGIPSVYTRVSSYVDWIQTKLKV